MYVKNLGFGLDYSHRLVSIKCSGQLPIWLVWTQLSGGRAGSMMHSWGNSCSLPIAFCKRGAERPELAALMLRQSSGSAAQWVSPFNTSRADSVTSVQGLRGSETLGLWSRSSGCLVSVSFQSLVVCSKAGDACWILFELFPSEVIGLQEKHSFRNQRSSWGEKTLG